MERARMASRASDRDIVRIVALSADSLEAALHIEAVIGIAKGRSITTAAMPEKNRSLQRIKNKPGENEERERPSDAFIDGNLSTREGRIAYSSSRLDRANNRPTQFRISNTKQQDGKSRSQQALLDHLV